MFDFFNPAIIFDVFRDGIELSLISMLLAYGLMKSSQFKKLGFDFKRSTVGACVIVDLVARNGTTLMSIGTIVLAWLLATKLWTHRHRLVFFGPLFQRVRSTRHAYTRRQRRHTRSRRRAA